MTILVTGASGTIGRCVVRQLVGAGQRVVAMSRTELAAGVEVRYGDFERPGSWAAALDGVQRVYLFSAAPEGFIATAVNAGVERFVTHSAAAAGFGEHDPATALGRHLNHERAFHRDLELAVEASGAAWTHVRPGLFAANALGWAEQLCAEGVVRGPYAAAGYPWVHEADVAEIAVAALVTDDHLGAAYTLTGPAKVSQAEQVRAIGAAIGRELTFEEIAPEEAKAQWHKEGLDADTADWLLEQYEDAVEGCGALPPTKTYDRLTGRSPRTFAQWARDHAGDFG